MNTKVNSNNIETIGELHARLEVIMRETGRSDLPLNISVLQETKNNPHGSYYEDRELCSDVAVVNVDGNQIVELYI
jgi:hypothetical protein